MDVQRSLRRLLPLLFLAALGALLLRRRREHHSAVVVMPPATVKEPLLLPPVEEALVVAEATPIEEITVMAVAAEAPANPVVERPQASQVDIVTVVDDLLGTRA